MEIKELLERVLNSRLYKNFNNDDKAYLCSFFKIDGEEEQDEWQVDFYNPEKDKITSFKEIGNQIRIIGKDSKIFKEKEAKVNELRIDKVKIAPEDAIKAVDELKKKKYSGEEALRRIVILQSTKELKENWNITYLTTSFNILNVKINAKNGAVIEESLKPALTFSKAS